MQESKSCALPLGDSPKGWVEGLEPSASRATIWRANQLRHTHHSQNIWQICLEGFEPPTHGLEGRCSIQLSYRHIICFTQKRVMGIEPTCLAWKASVLPLNYTRSIWIGVTGFEPAASWSQIKRSSQAEPHPDEHIYSRPRDWQIALYIRWVQMSTQFCNSL